MKSEKVLFTLGLFFSQVNYFNPFVSFILFAVMCFLMLVVTLQGKVSLNISRVDFLFLIIFLLMAVLTGLLFFGGSEGVIRARPLFLYACIQLFMFMVVVNNVKKDWGTFYLTSFFIYFVVESLVILGQYIYAIYGVGFQPKSELFFVFIEGTTLNPNNTAVMITAMVSVIALQCKLYGKYNLLALVGVVGLFDVFLASSRACTLLYGLFFLVLFYDVFFNEKLGFRIYFVFFLLVFLSAIVGVSDLKALGSQDIFDAVFAKLSTITELSDDESTQFRVNSMIRLFESFDRLDFGSLSDLNYATYFNTNDEWLNTVNPHSFLAEYSFLFGYLGFLLAFSLSVMLIFKIYTNKKVTIGVRFALGCMVFILPFVPSSVLAMPQLFIVFYLMGGGYSDRHLSEQIGERN